MFVIVRQLSRLTIGSSHLVVRPLSVNKSLFPIAQARLATTQTQSATPQAMPLAVNAAVELGAKKLVETSTESPSKKARPVKKKPYKKPSFLSAATPSYTLKAYATADFYDLDELRRIIIDSAAYEIYDVAKELPDDCVCVKAKYALPNESEPRHIFFFEDGTVVFWNVSREEEKTVLELLRKSAEKPYPAEIVNEESEMLSFSRIKPRQEEADSVAVPLDASFIRAGSYSSLNTTRLLNSHIYFKTREKPDDKEHLLEKYTFSDAIALSVKLGIWEKRLEQFAENIEYLTDDLKRGRELKLTNREVLMKLGELFTMRHTVNLYSNFLDTPDFYWDREHLEHLYSRSTAYLSISKRTKVFNDKLSHCLDLMEILKQNLTDAKHTRLEWIIIYLIAIEVAIAFGVLDLLKNVVVKLVDN